MLEQHTTGQKYTNGLMPQLSDLICGLQLDFSIVVVSVVVLALDALLPSVQWLKGLRVLRALKPLRSQLFTEHACLYSSAQGTLLPSCLQLFRVSC